jgi:outer membrane protein OmpA-like peptidoglycan-associated protein
VLKRAPPNAGQLTGGIKARPGWLIVVSGHTDNTGSVQLNQTLS